MSNSSSDKAKSKTPGPDTHHETPEADEQSDYYYDDATGYENYVDNDDEDDETNEQLPNRDL